MLITKQTPASRTVAFAGIYNGGLRGYLYLNFSGILASASHFEPQRDHLIFTTTTGKACRFFAYMTICVQAHIIGLLVKKVHKIGLFFAYWSKPHKGLIFVGNLKVLTYNCSIIVGLSANRQNGV